MTFDWYTKKINHQRYYKAIRRCIILNSSKEAWDHFKKLWHVIVMDVKDAEKYKHMYEHLKVEGSGGMAWGVTGKFELIWFVNDSRDPRVFMSNLPPGFHECLHALHQQEIGTEHVTYKTCGNPAGATCMKGKKGPAATVIVHDVWYGTKRNIKIWFSVGLMYVPVRMPYAPVEESKRMYDV